MDERMDGYIGEMSRKRAIALRGFGYANRGYVGWQTGCCFLGRN